MKRLMLSALLLVVLAAGVLAQGNRDERDQRDERYKDPAELALLIQGREQPAAQVYYLVDVRTAEEYAGGHLPTAVNIPNDEIGARQPTADKDALIVVYCASGRRSAAAKGVLDGLGYKRVVDFGARSRWTGELIEGDKPTVEGAAS